MGNRITKSISVLVSALLIFAQAVSVAGCSKNKGAVRKVSKDSVWYNASSTEIGNRFKGKKPEYYETEMCGVYKDGILIYTTGWFSSGSNLEAFDYYNFNGELVYSIDASEDLINRQIEQIIIGNDGIKIRFFNQLRPVDVKETQHFTASLNLEKGTIENIELAESVPDSASDDDWAMYEETYAAGDYVVVFYEKESNRGFKISRDGKSKDVDLAAISRSTDIFTIGGFITVSENEIIFVCYSTSVKFLSLNLKTGELKDKDEEYSWLNQLDYKSRIASFGGKTYITDQSGIKCINFETKQLDDVVSFNSCNINRAEMGRLKLVCVEGDRYVLAGDVYRKNSLVADDSEPESVPVIVVLEKADNNPNAGKIIITAAAAGETDLTYTVCEAIRLFNETNEKYFVQIDSKLRLDDYIDFSSTDDSDARMNLYYKGSSALGNQLAADIISGNGPDIILNAGDFMLIQSEDYLVDLNSFVKGKNGINEADYFGNVINAAKTNDKLLYMPLSFSVDGIATDKSNVRDGQVGFTFDEYVKFVDEVCNGINPLDQTQTEVLCDLFPYLSDTCINGKEADFDNASFRALCGYVKDNVIYKPDRFPDENDPALYDIYYNIGSHLRSEQYRASKMTLLGYPSTDGRGPAIKVEASIGISAFAPSAVVEGAWEFIKAFLSDDIQDLVAMNYNPISLNAFDSSAKTALESYNKAFPRFKQDESAVASYKNVLLSASVMDNLDPAIIVVLREEMPPYFIDQKSLDDILPIIKNRVTTILAERT